MRKASHYLNFSIPGLVNGEAKGVYGIAALCFIALLLASVVVSILK